MRKIVLFFLISGVLSNLNAVETFSITRRMRPLQIDALLMEWNSDFAVDFDNISVDAAFTPDYVVGYFKYPLNDIFKNGRINLSSSKTEYQTSLKCDSVFQDENFAIDIIESNDLSYVILEWQILKDKLIALEEKEIFSLNAVFLKSDGAVIKTIEFIGAKINEKRSVYGKLLVQLLLILILITLFLHFKRRNRKKLLSKPK